MNIWLKEVIKGFGLTGKIEKETASVGADPPFVECRGFQEIPGRYVRRERWQCRTDLADAKQRKASIAFFIRFFNALAEHVPGWAPMMGGLLPAEVREDMLIGHAVFLEALAVACRPLLLDERGRLPGETCDLAPLAKLASINPNKSAPSWKYRT